MRISDWSSDVCSSDLGDLERLDRRLLPWLESIDHPVHHAPAPPAIRTILGRDVGEHGFQRIRHALRRAMRDVELLAAFIKPDPAAPRSAQQAEPESIMSLAERPNATLPLGPLIYCHQTLLSF